MREVEKSEKRSQVCTRRRDVKLAPLREFHHVNISIQHTIFHTAVNVIHSDRCSQRHKKGICFIRPSCTTETSVWMSKSVCVCLWGISARLHPRSPCAGCDSPPAQWADADWSLWCSVFPGSPPNFPGNGKKNKENRLNWKPNSIICQMSKISHFRKVLLTEMSFVHSWRSRFDCVIHFHGLFPLLQLLFYSFSGKKKSQLIARYNHFHELSTFLRASMWSEICQGSVLHVSSHLCLFHHSIRTSTGQQRCIDEGWWKAAKWTEYRSLSADLCVCRCTSLSCASLGLIHWDVMSSETLQWCRTACGSGRGAAGGTFCDARVYWRVKRSP